MSEKETENPKYKVEKVADKRYANRKPVTGKIEKAVVNDQLTDVEVTDRYPRSAQSENYRVDVVAPVTGVPMVQIKPVGWVGNAPLQVIEARLDELIELLSKVR